MFNYVVKDPDSSRLSGEFWIKDSVPKLPCVLELDCACVLQKAAYRTRIVRA